jgi:group II intron reverse transcriptase/maturase
MKDKKTLGTQSPQQSPKTANKARLPWSALELQVVRMQKQIAQACQRGDRQAVHNLQQRLMESEAARLLAVHRVTEENQGKHTAGVDGIKSLTHQERLAMASTIHPKNWNHQPPMPVRRVWVPKPGTTEQRPLAVLSMIDRCKQALVKLALEPEWEVKFELHSYAFRPGRGTHDAIAAILVAIERHPCFVFDADIEGAFDHINHAVVLEKLQAAPAIRRTIHAWLTAGVMDGEVYSASETGIAQGGVLSPLLMNVALHGMEEVVRGGSGNGDVREQPLLIRYADDFVILHADLNELQQAVRRARHWLATMGLQLHADKTRITHTLTPYQGQVGFDFLGFNIRQESVEKSPREKSRQEYATGSKDERPSIRSTHRGPHKGPAPFPDIPGPLHLGGPPHPKRWHVEYESGIWVSGDTGMVATKLSKGHTVPGMASSKDHPYVSSGVKTVIGPSQEASKRHLAHIDQRLRQLQTAPQAQVIAQLNPLIAGWAANYNGIVPAATMRRYDDVLEQRLLHWASKRHPGKEREWLLARYWRRVGENRRVFAAPEGVELRMYQQLSILRG